jgi:hypothetical protein
VEAGRQVATDRFTGGGPQQTGRYGKPAKRNAVLKTKVRNDRFHHFVSNGEARKHRERDIERREDRTH